jgi:hypothetical protein
VCRDISSGAGSAIGGAVSGISSLIGSGAQSSAISNASSNAIAAEESMYNQTRSDLSPYNTTGQTAETQQANLLGLNGQTAADTAMSTYQTSPGYQWQMSEGLKGVDAGAAASGMLRSGATLKAEDTYAAGLANSDFSNYYSRLSGLTTTGESAASQQASSNTSTGSQLASTYTGAGNAQSSIYGNTASGVSNTVNSLMSNPNFQNWINNSGSGSGSIYNTGSGSGSNLSPSFTSNL